MEDKLLIRDRYRGFGIFDKVELRGIMPDNSFYIRPVSPGLEEREYDGNLLLKTDLERLLILNITGMENYIAGVVQTEGGEGNLPEYYKTQAIICRTYTFGHIQRHEGEGFNLCDGVHCQAYKGRCSHESIIYSGTIQTSDLVIIDQDSTLITAAFHSNCGGMTASSKSVWLSDKPYLQPVRDPFCTNHKNSIWQFKISLDDWLNYLIRNGVAGERINSRELSFRQDVRKEYYIVSGVKIPFSKIREDWNLRSSFFDIGISGTEVILEGRGYGHGVGLCQEGAMEMAQSGKNYNTIITFYYRGVSVVEYSTLGNLSGER
ncbi:MAG: SpoIID/LytB domain-containing protein [Bacteroidales bacterium]|nr:MAG: SpoIID/LytB domain-containing protein [Bacteroidales bacterium]